MFTEVARYVFLLKMSHKPTISNIRLKSDGLKLTLALWEKPGRNSTGLDPSHKIIVIDIGDLS